MLTITWKDNTYEEAIISPDSGKSYKASKAEVEEALNNRLPGTEVLIIMHNPVLWGEWRSPPTLPSLNG